MSSQSVSNTSSAQRSSSASPSLSPSPSSMSSTSSSSVSQRVSSQAPSSSSSLPSLHPTSSSSKIATTSPSTLPQSISISTSSPTNDLRSASISQISSSQVPIPSHAAIADAQVTPVSHRPGVIAAIAASIVGVLLLALLVFFLCRRRRIQMQRRIGSSISSQGDPFMREYPGDKSAEGWAATPSPTTVSGSGSGWPAADVSAWPTPIPLPVRADRLSTHRQSFSSIAGGKPPSLPGAGKAPHYSVRSRASVTDVYGFGQDVAWKEAHYENPVPPPVPPLPLETAAYPEIELIPPTPGSSAIIHHNTGMPPNSATLLRSASTASSVSSHYSTASMILPEPSIPPDVDMIHDPSLPQDISHEGPASRRLV